MTDNVGKRSEQIVRNEREHDKIWNAAIEAAAMKSESNGEIFVAMEISKLKK